MSEASRLDCLVACLADGQYHSGEELGRLLGVSRTAVWKQLQKLDDYGLAVESVKGRGYRLGQALDLLQLPIVRDGLLDAAKSLLDINLLVCTDSTNARAMAAASTTGVHGRVWLAEQQSAGRGRRGRQWLSPFAANLYLSMGWHFHGGVGALSGLSLAIGVACARALRSLGFESLQLKWPNDLLVDGKKLGGILIEMTGDPSGECRLVVGVGLNVSMPGDASIDQPWTDLHRAGLKVSRSELAARLLNELHAAMETFEHKGFAAFRYEWQQLDAYAHQPVCIISGAQRCEGVARGVDEAGALLLETVQGVQAIHGGEVSVRKAS